MEFRRSSGHRFQSQPANVIDVFTETTEAEFFCKGDEVIDENSTHYTLLKGEHVTGNIFKFTLLPLPRKREADHD